MTTSAHLHARIGRATIGDAFRRNAERRPGKPAIVVLDKQGNRCEWTYGALNDRVNQVARWLTEAGARRGDVLAIVAPNCEVYIVLYLAALKLGLATTGVNPAQSVDDVCWQIDHAGARIIAVHGDHPEVRDALAGHPAVRFTWDTADPRADWRLLDVAGLPAGPEPETDVSEDDLALLSYTSGTTSRPKGVRIKHRSYLLSTMPALLLAGYIGPHDRYMFIKPFYTLAGLGSLTSLLMTGATIVLPGSRKPDHVLRAIAAERVTKFAQTPTFFAAMAQHEDFASADLSTVEQLHSYGGVLSRDTLARFIAKAPHVRWASYWGQSELAQLGAIGWFARLEDIPGGDLRWIGRPTSHLDVRVVDEHGTDAEVGELICRSPSLMAGYHRDEERTQRVLTGGWLRTGDVVRIDAEGNLYFLDRLGDVIKTGGMNVSSAEVESVLLESEHVLEAAVVGMPDEYWAEAVTAAVVGKPGTRMDVAALTAHCRERLAGFKRPKRIVVLAELPKDAQGKIRKREVRDLLARQDDESTSTE
ncbi:class I adenylate-forming enzyme family protein [Prauserella flavalba]|uniref:Uncharacterized protein n=1 Tax=Prauserella flavalba TaxID=1477506 RepID=A0A318LAR8_9PSEU|nr:class I adenylate-forming enzyme family protein [Prauserella flavalba]PXY18722.1 hypothetical protein BA062_34515 [Prauserella flavalba]